MKNSHRTGKNASAFIVFASLNKCHHVFVSEEILHLYNCFSHYLNLVVLLKFLRDNSYFMRPWVFLDFSF